MNKIINIKSDATENTQTKVEALVEEFQNQEINISNYKRYEQKLQGMKDILVSQIQSYQTQYKDARTVYMDWQESDEAKKYMQEKNMVPYEPFLSLFNTIKFGQSIMSLFNYLALLDDIFQRKISPVLEEINGLNVRGDALKEIKEESKMQREWTERIVTTQIQNLQSLFESRLDSVRTHNESMVNQRFGELVEVFRLTFTDSKQSKLFDQTLKDTKKPIDQYKPEAKEIPSTPPKTEVQQEPKTDENEESPKPKKNVPSFDDAFTIEE